MNNVFEIIDKTGRKVRLTKERWKHILGHKGIEQYLELIQETLKKPVTRGVCYFSTFCKAY